jgi:flagellar hook-associated protein 2
MEFFMSTISGATPSLSSSAAAAAAEASAQSALQEAGQSLIGGSTGNTSLDVQSIVTAVVNSKVAGQTAALTTEAANDNTQISAIGTLSASLSSLQVGLAPLFNGTLQSTFTATASGSGLTASAATGAVAGSYSVDVTQIAQAQSLSSGAFTTAQSSSLGTGNLTISVGSKSMQLAVTSTNDTLSDIASAINGSSSNPGLSATVVNGSDGQHLVLSSTTTGAANTITVNVSNLADDNGLSSLGVTSAQGATTTSGASTIASAGSIAWSQSTAAQDAQFTLNGTSASSASNTVTTVLTGVTMNLSAAAVGTMQSLTIAPDTSTQVNDIETFVSDYNAVVSTMSSLSSFNSSAAAGSQGGPLLGDSMLNTIQSTLGNIVSGSVSNSGVTATLSSLGISLESNGQLSVDSSALASAVQSNPSQVAALFNSTNGVAAQLNTSISAFTKTGGIVDIRTDKLTSDLQAVTTRSTAMSTYTQQLTSQYHAKFTALNSLMATTNNNSQYLTQLFGGAKSAGAMATNK